MRTLADEQIATIEKALANGAEILANFTAVEAHADGTPMRKLEEWQACYALLFKQLNDAVQLIHHLKEIEVLIKKIADAYDSAGNNDEIVDFLTIEEIIRKWEKSK